MKLCRNEGLHILYSKEPILDSICNNFLFRSESVSKRPWALFIQVILVRHRETLYTIRTRVKAGKMLNSYDTISIFLPKIP